MLHYSGGEGEKNASCSREFLKLPSKLKRSRWFIRYSHWILKFPHSRFIVLCEFLTCAIWPCAYILRLILAALLRRAFSLISEHPVFFTRDETRAETLIIPEIESQPEIMRERDKEDTPNVISDTISGQDNDVEKKADARAVIGCSPLRLGCRCDARYHTKRWEQ